MLGGIISTEVVPFANVELANRSFHSNCNGRIGWNKKILELHRVIFAIVEIVGFDMSLVSIVVHIDSLIEVIRVNSLNLSLIPVIEPFVCISILESVLPRVVSIDLNIVRDCGWVERNDVSVGGFTELPDTAADLFSFVENSRGPVVSVVADVRADIDVILLDQNLRLPVSVLDVPLRVGVLSVRGLDGDSVRAFNEFFEVTHGGATHVCLHGDLHLICFVVDLIDKDHLIVFRVVQVINLD